MLPEVQAAEQAVEHPVAQRVREVMGRPDLPAFQQHIQEVLRYAGDEGKSIRELTAVLLREYALSLKLIRTANSPLYNRSGRPILSVGHAASLMGMQAIRDVAAGMLFFEHFRARGGTQARQLMMLSLLSANHAREMAVAVQYPKPEEAYLCGMFRNLGEVLVACYFPEEYQRVLQERQSKNLSERLACRKVLRFEYEELARAMVESWSLPEAVGEAMHEYTPGKLRLGGQHKDSLVSLVSFSHQLTDCVYRSESGPQSRNRVTELREAFHGSLGISKEKMEKILDTSVAEAKETSRVLSIPLDSLRLKQQIAVAFEAPEEDEDWTGFQASLERLRGRVEDSGFELSELLQHVLEEVCRAGPFDRALFAVVDPRHNLLTGSVGHGRTVEALSRAFRFPLNPRGGPIAVSVLKGEDVFHCGTGRKGEFPAMQQTLGSRHFVLCPIRFDNAIQGCLFCDRENSRNLSDGARQIIAEYRNTAAIAMQKARAKL